MGHCDSSNKNNPNNNSKLNNNNNIIPLKNQNIVNINNSSKCNCIICSEQNEEIKIAKLFLVNDCLIPFDLLDTQGDLTNDFNGWRMNSYNGPPGYLKKFIPPIGWTTIGLKVLNKYDNGDNTWLGTKNVPGEWYIGYHGIKFKNSINGILTNRFLEGPNQSFEFYKNKNPLTYYNYFNCGRGVYFTPEINEANSYTDIIKYNQYNLRIVFMCRINPYKVRIADKQGAEYWLTNGGTDEVRPYRILFKFENNNIILAV